MGGHPADEIVVDRALAALAVFEMLQKGVELSDLTVAIVARARPEFVVAAEDFLGQGRDLIRGNTRLAVVALEMTNNIVRLLELAVATRTVDVARLGRWDGRIDLGFVVLMEVVRLVVASETIVVVHNVREIARAVR